MLDQNTLDTAHLLRRAGFGATTAQIQTAAQRGLAATTDALLHPEATPDTFDDDAVMNALLSVFPEERRINRNGYSYLPLPLAKMWWLMRMVTTPHPLVEKMTLFWHSHFTSKDGVFFGEMMMQQNQLFRANALGNFRTLTLAVAKNPEMLRYLNGNQNYKAHANENFGRELMELYTCGIGNYTEDDVKAASRAFTGWNLRRGEFFFNPEQHDNSQKTFMGQTGNWNGDDIIDILVAHPATARRLCGQLFAYFAYPDPEPAVMDSLVNTYYTSGYDIRAIMGQILRSKAFYSEKARYAVIKTPVQYVVGTVNMLGLASSIPTTAQELSPDAAQPSPEEINLNIPSANVPRRKLATLTYLLLAMSQMGQDIMEPPSVKGWDGGTGWINCGTMQARSEFAEKISRTPLLFDGQFQNAAEYARSKNLTMQNWPDFLAETLGPLQLAPQTRAVLAEYVAAEQPYGQNGFADGPEARLRGAIPLLMSAPEYHVC